MESFLRYPELQSEAEVDSSQLYGLGFPTIDFESSYFGAEYSDRGFGILRLVPRADPQPGLQLRVFEELDNSKQEQMALAGSVSLVRLKQLATEMLPRTSHLRALILLEQDTLPRELAIAKVEIFSRLLYKELARL